MDVRVLQRLAATEAAAEASAAQVVALRERAADLEHQLRKASAAARARPAASSPARGSDAQLARASASAFALDAAP